MLQKPPTRGFFHSRRGKESMAKIIIYLRDQENDALHRLAQKEYRQPKAQAALMIQRELERLGMLDIASNTEAFRKENGDDQLEA
jgi:hypothetical protein